MFRLDVKRKRGRVLLGTFATFEAASTAALAWWCKHTEYCTPEELKGTWLESFDHQQQTRIWFFVPELSTLEALGWTMPGCEVRCAV